MHHFAKKRTREIKMHKIAYFTGFQFSVSFLSKKTTNIFLYLSVSETEAFW